MLSIWLSHSFSSLMLLVISILDIVLSFHCTIWVKWNNIIVSIDKSQIVTFWNETPWPDNPYIKGIFNGMSMFIIQRYGENKNSVKFTRACMIKSFTGAHKDRSELRAILFSSIYISLSIYLCVCIFFIQVAIK